MIINDIDKFIHLALSLSFTVTDNISLQNITITIGAYSPYTLYVPDPLATNRIYL